MKSYFFLHGFLGSGMDWNIVKQSILQAHPLSTLITPDFLHPNQPENLESFDSLIHNLRIGIPGQRRIFVGYSLGGRVGLNWMRLFPQDFQHWVFVSTHPGLLTEKEKISRAESDQTWTEKLEKLDLNEFVKQWDSQTVFDATNLTQNNQIEFDRKKLQACFLNLSLSRQQDHREVIRKNQDCITWIVGEKDRKFFKVAQDLKDDLMIGNLISLEAGHRVHFDQPAQLAKIISEL